MDLDNGNAAEWAKLEQGAIGKRSKLLSEVIGLTNFNRGLDSMMLDILDPYKILMTRLQIQNKPVSHRVVDWVLEYFRSMNTKFLSVSPVWGKNYRQWLTNNVDTDNQHTMERQVQAMGRQFVRQLCTSLRRRLQPYWSLLLACQLANPLSARYMPDSSRAAAKDLCIRAGMTERKAISVVEELDDYSSRETYTQQSSVVLR